MCGIAGGYGRSDADVLDRMLESIYHRGPDESGTYMDETLDIMMGTRRLSIVDPGGGSQPLHNENGTVTVCFNGEIYNHQSLRSKLKELGHTFQTRCDTEVLVHLWEEYGVRVPEHLNGMFAFAIWDETRKSLFLSRDRMGIKPLYYMQSGNNLLFASELKALLTTNLEFDLDKQAIYNYFSLRYWPWPQTPFESIRKVQPGNSLLITEDGISEREYWRLSYSSVSGSKNAVAGKLRSKLERSVERRMMADIPLGAFLSGGLDSSAIVGIMSDLTNDVRTFSIGFEDSTYDESTEAKYVADHFGTNHNELRLDLSSMDLFGDVVSHYGEPLSDPATLPTLALSRYASNEIKTVLTGEGADELFGGYWYTEKIPYHRHRFGWIPEAALRLAERVSSHMPYREQSFWYVAALRNNDTAIEAVARQFQKPPEEYTNLDTEVSDSGLQDMVAETNEIADKNEFNRRMTAFNLTRWLPGDLLYKVDHATMAASLEARVPFLDRDIVEFAYGIPTKYKMDGYKPILNSAVSELLPERTLDREKHGFSVPTTEWFRHSHEAIEMWLSEPRLGSTPYIDVDMTFELWNDHRSGNTDNSAVLWKILNYTAWYHTVAKDRI